MTRTKDYTPRRAPTHFSLAQENEDLSEFGDWTGSGAQAKNARQSLSDKPINSLQARYILKQSMFATRVSFTSLACTLSILKEQIP